MRDAGGMMLDALVWAALAVGAGLMMLGVWAGAVVLRWVRRRTRSKYGK